MRSAGWLLVLAMGAGVARADGHHPRGPRGGEREVRHVGGAVDLLRDARDAGQAELDRQQQQVHSRRRPLRDGGVPQGSAQEELRANRARVPGHRGALPGGVHLPVQPVQPGGGQADALEAGVGGVATGERSAGDGEREPRGRLRKDEGVPHHPALGRGGDAGGGPVALLPPDHGLPRGEASAVHLVHGPRRRILEERLPPSRCPGRVPHAPGGSSARLHPPAAAHVQRLGRVLGERGQPLLGLGG
mmetsp:Transcript_40284/g.75440  ORF Transcript_40284/g.75440 Transcript_40284/m.75440 type:complete len:246 (-) Transcript_40284:1888-2625(-)